MTNETLYVKLPALSNKIAARRLQLAGHCQRHPELSAHKLVLWEPTHGQQGHGRQKTNYVDTLRRDTGAENSAELATLMVEGRSGGVVWHPACGRLSQSVSQSILAN